jgi:hypothetical protein
MAGFGGQHGRVQDALDLEGVRAQAMRELEETENARQSAELARHDVVEKQRTAWTVIANGRFELGEFDKAEGAYLQVQTLGRALTIEISPMLIGPRR